MFKFLKKNQKKNLMVASNLDDVFHIVFIATDRSTTKNKKKNLMIASTLGYVFHIMMF